MCVCVCVCMHVCVCHMLSLWVVTGTQVLTLESLASSNIDDSIDPFTNRLLEFEVPIHHLTSPVVHIHCTCTQEGGEFTPVKVDREILKSIPKSEVIIKKWGPRGGNQYYKLLLPEVQITLCKQCQQVSK